MILSLILGGAAINHEGFWYDETVSIGFITDSAAWYAISPEQMPVYYLALRGWTDVVGRSEIAGRWLALLFGLLTLAVTYRLAADYAARPAALLALLLLASSAFFVRYYREMRPYTLLALLCTLSMWLFLRWIRRKRPGGVNALLYVVVSILAIYTHYFAGLVIAVQGVYFMLAARLLTVLPRPRVRLNRFALATLSLFAVIALSIMPYVVFYASGLEFVTSGRFAVFALTPAEAAQSSLISLTNDSPAAFLIVALLALSARARGSGLALLWTLLPLAATLFVHTFVYRMFAGPRYLIFIWPAFAILAALGLAALPMRARWIAAGVLVAVGAIQAANDLPGTLPGTLNNPPWREMFAAISQRAQPGALTFVNMVDPVGLTGYIRPMRYYFGRSMPPGAEPPIELDSIPQPEPDALREIAGRGREVWFIATDGESNERGERARAVLREMGYAPCQRWDYPEYRSSLTHWGRVDGATINFENGARLQRAPLRPIKAAYRRGEPLDIVLGLYTAEPLALDYSLGVYVLDAAGELVAQQDGPPASTRTSTWMPEARYCDARALRLPEAPGEYSVLVALYDAISGERVAAPPDSRADRLIRLMSVRVE